MTIIALTADLFFRAKIEETAKALGLERPRPASSPDHAGTLAREEAEKGGAGALVLVELSPRTGGVEAVEKIRAAAPTARVVAFGSHVDTETLARARELGATEVMARSQFVKDMPRIFGGSEK